MERNTLDTLLFPGTAMDFGGDSANSASCASNWCANACASYRFTPLGVDLVTPHPPLPSLLPCDLGCFLHAASPVQHLSWVHHLTSVYHNCCRYDVPLEHLRMRDGSFESDVPVQALSELFNCHFTIVSQVPIDRTARCFRCCVAPASNGHTDTSLDSA